MSNQIPQQPLPGGILPGSLINLDDWQVQVDHHVAGGGFAQVYGVFIVEPREFQGNLAVLKKIHVQDEEGYDAVKREVEIMNHLTNAHEAGLISEEATRHICKLYKSKVQKGQNGWDAMLVMEYCAGGNAVNLLNHLLQTGKLLTEVEIWEMFDQVCQAVAVMHYQQPPILHRDIKLENVLLTDHWTNGNVQYKLCDFGSATTSRFKSGQTISSKEIQKLEEEINSYTTIQYRAPEMIDLYQKKGIDEKIDIWALGILLYKLCYYQTPFDDGNKLAILNCIYALPPNETRLPNNAPMPRYSQEMQHLIRSMLAENPRHRPNIYTVLENVSVLLGRECPVLNIFPTPTANIYDVMEGTEKPVIKDVMESTSIPPPKPPRRMVSKPAEIDTETVESMFDPLAKRSRPVPKVQMKPLDLSSFSQTSLNVSYSNVQEGQLIDLAVEEKVVEQPLEKPLDVTPTSHEFDADFDNAFPEKSVENGDLKPISPKKKPPPIPPKPEALKSPPPLPPRTEVAGEDPFSTLRSGVASGKPLFSDDFGGNVDAVHGDWPTDDAPADWDAFSMVKPK